MSKHITSCGVCGIEVCTLESDNDPVCAKCFEWAKRLENEVKEPVFSEALSNIWDSLESTKRVISVNFLHLHQKDILVNQDLDRIYQIMIAAQSKIENIHSKGVNYD